MNKSIVFIVMVTIIWVVGFFGCNTGTNGNTNQYTITFDTEGGLPVPAPVKVDEGKSISTLPTAPTKNSKIFGGWFTEKNGGGTEFRSDTVVTKDLTVYAKWLTKFEGTWNQTSGQPGNLQIIFSGDTYLLKQGSSNLKRCSFIYTETIWSETVLEDFTNGQFPTGTKTDVEYTLVGNVLTITTMGQVFNKVP